MRFTYPVHARADEWDSSNLRLWLRNSRGAKQSAKNPSDVQSVVVSPVVSAFHRHRQLFVRAIKLDFMWQSTGNGKQGFDVQIADPA